MDISQLSIAELEALMARIPAEIEKRKSDEKQKVLDEVAALAAKHGFALDELVAGAKRAAESKKGKGSRKPALIKYRHPNQSELTWTGRGRKPIWVAEWLAKGNTLEQIKA